MHGGIITMLGGILAASGFIMMNPFHASGGEAMHGGIITMLGGILAASGFIIAKKPNAKELIDKIVPYQGWIGIVMFFWGIWEILGCIRALEYLSSAPLFWVFWILSGIADLGVGFLLGFALISKYALSKNPTAMAKGQELRGKLMKIQIPLGFLAIVMGAVYIAMYIMWRAA